MKNKLFLLLLIVSMAFILGAWGPPEVRVWWSKTTAPTVNDDETYGYRTGDVWIDETNSKVYVLLDEGTGAADWDQINEVGIGANEVLTGNIKDGEIINADISPTAEIDPNKLALKSGTTDVVSGETNAVEWHPNPYEIATYRLTGTLSDPVVLLISETDTVGGTFSEGASFTIINAGTPVLAIGDIDGQQEVLPSGNTVYLPQNGRAKCIYTGSAWNVGVESTDRQTFDTINARVKTFSVSGITGTYQFSSISGVTIDLTESEACGYGLIDSGTSAFIDLPDPDPGSGYVGELGQALISIAGIDVTVTDLDSGATQVWVDGTATVVETGAVITTSTIGEYFTWAPAYVAQYGWRWMIRTKDD